VSVLAGIVVVAVTAAGKDFGIFSMSHDMTIIVVSALGSAAAALLTQLRTGAMARARAIGRVGMEDVWLRGRMASPDEPGFSELLSQLQDRIREIEYDQVDHLFPPSMKAKDNAGFPNGAEVNPQP
jgi:hypothetical protein